MATEDILIRYRADVSQLEADINKVIDSQQELTQATQQNTQAQQKAVTSAEFAAKKRAELLEQEKLKLIKLKEAIKLAFDPKDIDKFNKQITESQNRIELLSGKAKKSASEINTAFSSIQNSINNIASAFGLAFSIQGVIQFTRAAVNAFLDAENAALSLKNAIVTVGGETEAAYERLITQSRILQQTTIFGDDDIQNAQALLATFGLTAAQIEELTPKLADLAKALRTDIVGAAEKVGGALQGSGKAFKQLGIDVKASNTELENLQAILDGSDKFLGQAEAATKSLSGQLQQLQNDANNAQEEIGSKFAAAWANFTAGAFKAINALLGFNQATKDKVDARNIKAINDQLQFAEELEKKYGRQVIDTNQALLERTEALEKQQIKALLLNNQLKRQLEEEQKGITATIVGRSNATLALEEEIEKNNEILRQTQVQLDFIKGITDQKKEEAEQSARTLKADQLRSLNTQQLNDLLKKQLERYDIIGQANERLINAEIERRKKAEEEYKKQLQAFKALIDGIDAEIRKVQADLAKRKIEVIPATSFDEQRQRVQDLAVLNEQAINDEIAAKIKGIQEDDKLNEQQKKQIIAKFNELKKARLEFARFNQANELFILSKKQAEAITQAFADIEKLDFEKALTINAEEIEAANEAVAKSFEDLGDAVEKGEFEAAKIAAENATKELQKQIQARFFLRETEIENAREAEKQKALDAGATAEELLAIDANYNEKQRLNADQTYKDLKKARKEYDDFIDTQLKSETSRWIQKNQEILQQTASLVSELNAIFQQATENRISQIEEEKNAQLASIEEQLEANQEYFEKRRISEDEFAENQKALQDERVRIEKETQKKIREEKRKQAILDKAAAVFQIAINTAVSATNPAVAINPVLQALVILQGIIQTAAVVAQPIPYRKGSKDTGAKGHLARVGEEGEELVFMPSNSKVLPARQTRKYADIIDAMYDNKLDDYVYKNYITPALMAQKEAKDNQRAKSFAENMANSIVYNQTGLTPSDLEAQRKRGQYIRNVDEIAEAIAKKLPIRDIYRA